MSVSATVAYKSEHKNEHREDILRAAIAEFGRAGYKAASTNEIVKNAKVSKGLLFHHFTNKEKLYTACQLHVMEQYGKFMANNFNSTNPDLFERIMEGLRIKMEFGRQNPAFLALVNRAGNAEDGEHFLRKPEIESFIAESMQAYAATFFEGVDVSNFREGIGLEKVMDYTRLALEASWTRFSGRYNDDIAALLGDIDSYFAEAEEILFLLKNGAYN